jgi:hypothetical protein
MSTEHADLVRRLDGWLANDPEVLDTPSKLIREAVTVLAQQAAELALRRKSGSATERLHNLCEGIAADADGSEWSREEWERIDAENLRLRNEIAQQAAELERLRAGEPVAFRVEQRPGDYTLIEAKHWPHHPDRRFYASCPVHALLLGPLVQPGLIDEEVALIFPSVIEERMERAAPFPHTPLPGKYTDDPYYISPEEEAALEAALPLEAAPAVEAPQDKETHAYAEGRGDQYEDDCTIVRLLFENLDDADVMTDGRINTTRVRELLSHFDLPAEVECSGIGCTRAECDAMGCTADRINTQREQQVAEVARAAIAATKETPHG